MNFNNEMNYAKSLENTNFSNDVNYFSKCVTLVRYWNTINKEPKWIYENLYNKLKIIYKDFGDNVIDIDIENILNVASAKGFLENKVIKFSKEELDYIHSFNQLGFEKFLFIMFCGYKLSNDNNMFSIKHREVMRLSTNSYSKKDCNNLLRKSYINNIFDMQNFHNNLMYFPTENTLKLYNPDNIVLEITDFKNIVYYYLEYIGEGKYIRCKECGCIEKLKTNNQLYCEDCAREKQLEQSREGMRKIRNVK